MNNNKFSLFLKKKYQKLQKICFFYVFLLKHFDFNQMTHYRPTKIIIIFGEI